jgi:hypothetical protein
MLTMTKRKKGTAARQSSKVNRRNEDEQMILGKSETKTAIDPQPKPALSSNNPAPSAAAAAMTASPVAAPAQQQATFHYVDRPDMLETFADFIGGTYFDGQTLRIEFAVTRVDEAKANGPITAHRYPVCRVVVAAPAAIDLINRMQQIGAALTQAGVVKPTPRPTEAPKTT